MRDLWPTLEAIAARLSGAEIDASTISLALRDVPSVEADLPLPVPQATLQALFVMREAATKHSFTAAPQSGQVLLIENSRGKTSAAGKRLPCPLAVLLDAPSRNGGEWSGWLVAPDVDYAAYWDVVLDHRDEPFDPYAGMVQVWNPVSIAQTSGCRILAQLSAERLAAVRMMEQEYLARVPMVDETARPGFVAPRALTDGVLVLTGTRLGDAYDPRRVYQSLYWEAADTLRVELGSSNVFAFPAPKKQPAQFEDMPEAMAAFVEDEDKSRDTNSSWLKPAFIVAVIIVIMQMIAIGILLRDNHEAGTAPANAQMGEAVAPPTSKK